MKENRIVKKVCVMKQKQNAQEEDQEMKNETAVLERCQAEG
jgi:hypothetical protein